MAKSAVTDFDGFKQLVKACPSEKDDSVVSYQTIYGDTLTLDTRYKKTQPAMTSPSITHRLTSTKARRSTRSTIVVW